MSLTVTLFGITGDLSKTKLIPALWQLFNQGSMEEATFIGYGRKDLSPDEFRQLIHQSTPDATDAFLSRWQYVQGQIDDLDGYKKLADLQVTDQRLVYLAVGPELFETITSNVAESQILDRTPDHMLLIEKPFGHDLPSAQHLNTHLLSHFDEKQLYRIDHYLGKHALRTMPANPQHAPIDIIQTVKEGVGSRGSFFDSTGIVRDVVQNHLLEVAATVLCVNQSLEPTPENRVTALQSMQVEKAKFGQYKAYTTEPGVSPDSTRETLADITFTAHNQIIRLLAARMWIANQNEIIQAGIEPISLTDQPHYLLPHATLLSEAMKHQKKWFVSFEEIQTAWSIIDPLLNAPHDLLSY